MDQLRALAMLAGVLFHAALAYSPLMQPIWPLADRQASPLVDAVVWLPHLVRMPLFFTVSGFFAAWIIVHRGPMALLRQRLRRIALPFLLAWPLVILALSMSTEWAANHVQHPSALLSLIAEWRDHPDAPRLPPNTAHLWFLYYLLLFGVLHWIIRALELAKPARRLLQQAPWLPLLVLPLLITPALASVSAPHPAPEGLLPQFWAIAFYGSFFAFGALLHGEPDWMPRADKLLGPLLFGSAALYPLLLWRLQVEVPGAANPASSWAVALIEACLAVWLTVASLLLGRRWLDRHSPLMHYLAKSAYWTYLLHLPLLFAVQYWLMDRSMHWGWKFAIATTATMAGCLLSYQLLVRYTPLRRHVG
ncbi:MAG: acyltransferase family protein [Xanthomonadales bacterium]|nr:acyltransferase family protein [Xanthomonadales bacterium]